MPKKYEFDYDLIVIGSGPGGSVAATVAAREKKRVALVEADAFGGDSPNWGDIPTNALLHAAHLYDDARHGAKFGLRSSTLGYNYPSLRAWKNLAIKRTGAGDNRRYYENLGVNTFSGAAHFLSPNEISVNRRHLSATNFFIATGTHWVMPKIPGLDKIECLTPRTILETLRPPKSLLIIGGGIIGVEIAQLIATFGTKVYIVEKDTRLLPNQDSEVSDLMERVLGEQKGVDVFTRSQVVSIEKSGLQKRAVILKTNNEKAVIIDEILVAIGRAPTVDIGLENAGVKYTNNGIEVNENLQTSNKHIFAVGGVLGLKSNTHTALFEGQVAINNIFHKTKISPDYTAIPEVIFTNPGIATVGSSENNCQKQKIPINKALAPLSIIARSNTSDFRDGFVKIITDKKGVILGATVVAPHASEIIHELALAIKYQLTAADIASTPHAFLSWSEAVRVAASKLI